MRAGGYDGILRLIRAARTAIRGSETITGIGFTALAAGLSAVVLVGLDNLFRLPTWARVLLLVLAAGTTIGIFIRTVVRPATRPLSDDAVAVRIESAAGGMDNHLINALQLGRDEEEGLSGSFVKSVVDRGADLASRTGSSRVVNLPRLSRAVLLGFAALVAVLGYWAFLPDHFENAVARYTHPATFVPPISATRLAVEPGDTAVLRGEPVTVSAVAGGALPSTARILIETDGEFQPSEMLFDGQAFSFHFEKVEQPFRYRVEAADASSPIFRVDLADRPEIVRLELAYRFPDYLGREPRTDADATGEIRAPVGTEIEVLAEVSQPVIDAALRFEEGTARTLVTAGDRTLRGTFTVERDDTWSIVLRSRDGLGNRDPVRHRITAIHDETPVVEITAPAKDLTLSLPARVPVTIRARDDHGISEISLVVRRGDDGDFRVVKTWPANGDRDRVVSHQVMVAEGEAPPGGAVTYRAEARDAFPFATHIGRSRSFAIRVLSRRDRATEAAGALADLATKLRDLLERERSLRADTRSVLDAVRGGALALTALSGRASALAGDQSRIGADMVAVADAVPPGLPALAEVRGALLGLAVNEVMAASRRLQDSRSRKSAVDAGLDLQAAEKTEGAIVAKLEELLGRVDALVKRIEEDPDGWIDETMDEADPDAALREALAKLKKFIREQQEILEQTRELEKKAVDDFTDEDLKLLEKLAAQESDLARFLEDLKDDLSKIPDQDFSNSQVLNELIEAYSEVELAADALTRKRVELAVPLEQSGLELAKGLTENIEKWLPDARDSIKWNMEEFDGEYPDVPMADLPEQLEDLMGDLIEQEEELGEDMEDVTSGWADSIDKGAGWGVSDGPISNMSAQGKTGNTLPNTNEVGGRSGEGRTGRSHGEMVEAEATGKGGRRTPTRLTPDAWEGKAVKDRSTDPLGGATGGGKLAGGAGEGLAGPLPPEVKGDLGRLHGNQVGIRQKAETLDRALKALHYPDEELSRSVVLMKELEEALARGDLAAFSAKHGVLVEQMKDGQARILEHSRVVTDRSRAVPKEMMREMESIDLTGLPEGYRDLLREYYKILSRGGAR